MSAVSLTRVPTGVLLNALAARAWFGEALGAQKLLGIGFIILGAWLIARS